MVPVALCALVLACLPAAHGGSGGGGGGAMGPQYGKTGWYFDNGT